MTALFYAGFPRLPRSPGFFVENSRTWEVLENHFDPGKFWKLKLKVLGKCPWTACIFLVDKMENNQ